MHSSRPPVSPVLANFAKLRDVIESSGAPRSNKGKENQFGETEEAGSQWAGAGSRLLGAKNCMHA